MKRTASFILGILVMAVLCSGCMVAESKYLAKVDENTLLQNQVTALTEENTALKKEIANLTGQRDELDKILKSKTDDLSRSVSENRKKLPI